MFYFLKIFKVIFKNISLKKGRWYLFNFLNIKPSEPSR